MKKFAKLFEVGEEQVLLVKRDYLRQTKNHAVIIHIQLDDNIFEEQYTYDTTDERDKFFNEFSESNAKNYLEIFNKPKNG